MGLAGLQVRAPSNRLLLVPAAQVPLEYLAGLAVPARSSQRLAGLEYLAGLRVPVFLAGLAAPAPWNRLLRGLGVPVFLAGLAALQVRAPSNRLRVGLAGLGVR